MAKVDQSRHKSCSSKDMNTRVEPTIHQALHQDIPQLAELISSLFQLEPEYQPNPEKHSRGLELLMDRPDQGMVFCARIDSHIVGMVTVQLVASTAEGAYSAWLEDMYVLPAWRGQGLGDGLIKAASAWARKHRATRIQALVDHENARAFDFYRKVRFTVGRMVNISQKLR